MDLQAGIKRSMSSLQHQRQHKAERRRLEKEYYRLSDRVFELDKERSKLVDEIDAASKGIDESEKWMSFETNVSQGRLSYSDYSELPLGYAERYGEVLQATSDAIGNTTVRTQLPSSILVVVNRGFRRQSVGSVAPATPSARIQSPFDVPHQTVMKTIPFTNQLNENARLE
jgi:hypothetical protein